MLSDASRSTVGAPPVTRAIRTGFSNSRSNAPTPMTRNTARPTPDQRWRSWYRYTNPARSATTAIAAATENTPGLPEG
jgi:hypothetical protein